MYVLQEKDLYDGRTVRCCAFALVELYVHLISVCAFALVELYVHLISVCAFALVVIYVHNKCLCLMCIVHRECYFICVHRFSKIYSFSK